MINNKKKIDYLNESVTFLYIDNIYFFKNNKIEIAAQFHLDKKNILLELPLIYLKKYEIFLNGKGKINISNNSAFFKGNYFLKELKGKTEILYNNNTLFFNIDSKNFSNHTLKKITNLFPLHSEIKKWIYSYIKAKEYKLIYLRGKYNPAVGFKPENFTGKAVAKDVIINFNQRALPVKAKKVEINYKDYSLFFKLSSPVYKDKKLEGSFVKIENISKKDSFIEIFIKTSTNIDKTVSKLLNSYNIVLPFQHLKGIVNGNLNIKIFFETLKKKISGSFFTSSSVIKLHDTKFSLTNTQVTLKDKKIKIESLFWLDKFMHSFISGNIDIQNKKGDFGLNIIECNIFYKQKNIVSIKKLKERLKIDFSNKPVLSFLNSEVTLQLDKNLTKIYCADIAKLKKFIPMAKDIKISQGTLTISTYKFSTFHIQGKAKIKDMPFYSKSGKEIENFAFKGFIEPSKANIIFNDKVRIIYIGSPEIIIKDYNVKIDTKNFLKKKIPDFMVFGKNSNILMNNRVLLCEKYNINCNKNIITFRSQYKNSKLFLKKDRNLTIKIEKADEKLIKNLLKISGIKNGSYNIIAYGNIDNLRGSVTFFNATLKNMKVLNNIMAFINTVPALMTFSAPGYNKTGYYVKKGKFDFVFKNNILIIQNMKLISKSLNMEGAGGIDTKRKKIAFNLKLKTFKNVSKIISKIPVAGYILLGKEGEITTILKISGDIDKPTVKLNLTKEIINSPLNIIQRTLQFPFLLFKGISNH